MTLLLSIRYFRFSIGSEVLLVRMTAPVPLFGWCWLSYSFSQQHLVFVVRQSIVLPAPLNLTAEGGHDVLVTLFPRPAHSGLMTYGQLAICLPQQLSEQTKQINCRHALLTAADKIAQRELRPSHMCRCTRVTNC